MSDRSKITRSFSWNTLTVVLQVVVQLIYTAIIARLLLPENFALMGVVLSLMGFAEIFSQVGIGPAIIQRKDLHPQHLSGALYTAIILGLSFTSLFYFLAPAIAAMYHMPELTDVTRLVSTSFIISALGVVPKSMMIRELAFHRFFWASMISIVGGNLIVGLILAYSGWGVWAYVWALFAQNSLVTIMYWILQPVKFPLTWKWKYTRELVRYGSGSTLFNALNYAATKIDVAVIPMFARNMPGTDFSEQMRRAGLYERSAYVVSLPITIVGKLSDNVMFSGMSSMQSDDDRLRRAVLLAYHALSVIVIPAVMIAICFAPEITRLYLGNQYNEAIPILQILLAAVIFRTQSRIPDSLLRARDATFRGSWIKALYLLSMIAGIGLGAFFGMTWIAVGITLATALHLLLSMRLCQRILGTPVSDQVTAQKSGWLIGLPVWIVGAASAAMMRYSGWGDFPVLMTGLMISAGVIAAILYKRPLLLGRGTANLLHFLPARARSLRPIADMIKRTDT